MDHVDRQTRIAHLEIHGWEPVINRGSGRAGLWSEQLAIGYTVRATAYHNGVHTINRDVRENDYQPCSGWHEVTDWHLDRLEPIMVGEGVL